MRQLRSLFWALSLAFLGSFGGALTAHGGGNEVQNGGSGIYCPGSAPSAQILDYYESEQRHILQSLGAANLSVETKVDLAIMRLWNLDRNRANKYIGERQKFFDDALFLTNVTLVNVDDTNVTAIPDNCQLRQISLFRRKIFPEDKTYVIDKRLWDLLDNDNKAGLILHEIVYKEAAWEYQHTNSMRVRYFVSVLTSDRMAEMTPESYRNLLRLVELPALSDP